MTSVRVESLGRLDEDEVGRVALLVERATETDGVRPLSEHVALHLRHGGDAHVRNVLVYVDGALAAYAHLDVTDPVEGSSAELVVDPAHRGGGVGGRLVAELLRETPDGRLRLWAHGEHPAAARLAAHHGFDRVRVLWQLRRSLYAPIPPGRAAPRRRAARLRPRSGRRRVGGAQRARVRRPPRAGRAGRCATCGCGWPSRGSTRPGS